MTTLRRTLRASLFAAAAGFLLLRSDAGAAQALVDLGDTTLDPNTGLVWLDLSFTDGQSYNAVLNGFGGFTTTQGYRYATKAEVTQLYLNAGAKRIGFPLNPPVSVNVPEAKQLLSLLGRMDSVESVDQSLMYYDPATEPGVPTSLYVPVAGFGEGEVGGGYPDREGFFYVPGLYGLKDSGSDGHASALVKEVPEPTAPLLVGLGLTRLLGRRKR